MPFLFDADYLDTPSDIMGGFDRVAYIALADWIVEWPEVPPYSSSPTTPFDLIALSGAFVMEPQTAFLKVSGQAGLSSESQGERDCMSVHNSGQLFRAGAHIENIALQNAMNGAYGVVILTDGDDYIVVGDKTHPCWFTANVEYGANPAEKKGITINFEADSFIAGYRYCEEIPTFDNIMPLFHDGYLYPENYLFTESYLLTP